MKIPHVFVKKGGDGLVLIRAREGWREGWQGKKEWRWCRC
jgi:hypothetical protein